MSLIQAINSLGFFYTNPKRNKNILTAFLMSKTLEATKIRPNKGMNKLRYNHTKKPLTQQLQ